MGREHWDQVPRFQHDEKIPPFQTIDLTAKQIHNEIDRLEIRKSQDDQSSHQSVCWEGEVPPQLLESKPWHRESEEVVGMGTGE